MMQDMLKAIRRASNIVEALDITAASIAHALQVEIIRPDHIGHAIEAHTAQLRILLEQLATGAEAMAQQEGERPREQEAVGHHLAFPLYCPQCLGSFKKGNFGNAPVDMANMLSSISGLGDMPRQ